MSLLSRIELLEGAHRAGRRPTLADLVACAAGRDEYGRYDWSDPIWAQIAERAREEA